MENELLISAAENAKSKYKVEILVKASCVNLGDLISIDYNWDELHCYFQIRYEVEEKCMSMSSSCATNIEFPSFRKILIDKFMKAENYSKVINLAIEG